MSSDSAGVVPASGAGLRERASWILFDWAAQPFFTLVTTFVFAPFFAARIAATPAEGQALWGLAAGAAGLAIALLSPVLGAVADVTGRRKAWIAAFSVLLVAGCMSLWLAVPGAPHAVPIALLGFAVATIGAEFATVFTNAMMPSLAPPERLGRLSGAGWAAGYAGGLVSLAVVLAFLAGDPGTGRTLAGLVPILGLDPASGEGDRAAGPFSALWYLVFVLPLFLFAPDIAGRSGGRDAVRQGLAELRATLTALPRHRDLALYLLAHMAYIDGLGALFVFAGIYAAGTFGWGTIEIGLFGIMLTVTGTVGALVGGRLDDRFGPKAVLAGALVILILCGIGILSIGRSHVLFLVGTEAAEGRFASTPERLYVGLGLVIGAVAGPLQSASRTLLARLAPADAMTSFFGLHALSGKVTSFLGPLAVGAVTAWTASQQAGMAVLIGFFSLGLALLMGVRVPPLVRQQVPV